jgi:hypothetical protein
MKKLIGISAITLGMLITANSAFAENQIGQSLCSFTARILQNAGYTTNATLTGSGIIQLLNNINVTPPRNLHVIPQCRYRTYYICSVLNNLDTAGLCIAPIDYRGRAQLITWPVTKPNYQDQDYNYS